MKIKKAVLDIIKTCKAVEERRLNPFLIDFLSSIKILRKYLALCKTFKDYCLDGKALNALSKVIELQNAQLLFQSSKLYVNPEILKRKIYSLSLEDLTNVFLKSWHPIIEMEQLTLQSIINGLSYWRNFSPYRKFKIVKSNSKAPTIINGKTLRKNENLSNLMVKLWKEMIELTGEKEKIDYWMFIRKNDFSTTVKRAYITSFLISYGYAFLIKCGDELYLIPNKKFEKINYNEQVSFPISIKKEEA